MLIPRENGDNPSRGDALSTATRQVNTTIVQWLLGKGADEALEEALEHGVNKGQQEIVRLLLDRSANPNRLNALRRRSTRSLRDCSDAA